VLRRALLPAACLCHSTYGWCDAAPGDASRGGCPRRAACTCHRGLPLLLPLLALLALLPLLPLLLDCFDSAGRWGGGQRAAAAGGGGGSSLLFRGAVLTPHGPGCLVVPACPPLLSGLQGRY
jgi:hypothetical protein